LVTKIISIMHLSITLATKVFAKQKNWFPNG